MKGLRFLPKGKGKQVETKASNGNIDNDQRA